MVVVAVVRVVERVRDVNWLQWLIIAALALIWMGVWSGIGELTRPIWPQLEEGYYLAYLMGGCVAYLSYQATLRIARHLDRRLGYVECDKP